MSLNDRISLGPSVSDVAHFNWWLDERIAASGIERTIGADLKLCLNEILANLISYGFESTREPQMTVEIELQREWASAIVSDNGTYFDIRAWEVPSDRDLLMAEHGGFGIGLVREHATRLSYTRADGLNHLRIVCEGTSH